MKVAPLKVDPAESLSLLGELVKIGSVNPYEGRGSGETEIAEFIRDRLDAYGLHTRLQSVKGRRANVIGTLKGSVGDGKSLMLNGHIDTVDVTSMKIDPFGATLDERGRLHGRGACDMKGSIASMMAAIKAVVDRGPGLKGDLVFAGVVDEEYMSLGTKRLIEKHRTDGAIVGEPTSLKVGLAHKGYVWMEVEVKGKPAHGSVPEQGVDAILEMSAFIARLPGLREKYAKIIHPLLGTPKIHASMIEGGTEWSVLPEACRLKVERRTIPGETGEDAVEELENLAEEISSVDREFSARVTKFFEQSPMEVSPEEEVVRCVAASYKGLMGAPPAFVGVPYWTDAALLMNEAGIPTCVFGPGDIRLAHSEDEYVEVDEVAMGATIFASTMLAFCGTVER